MLATRLARCSKTFRLGASFNSVRIAKDIVPVVLHRPILVKVGLATAAVSVVTACNATAWCVGTDTLVDDFFSELLNVAVDATPVIDGYPVDAGLNTDADAAEADGEEDWPEEEEDDLPLALHLGESSTHDLLGVGVVVAIGSTQEVSDGILLGSATFDSLELPADKVLFRFLKRVRVQGRGPARFKDVETLRAVFADALTPLGSATADGASEDKEDDSQTAFGAMAEAASGSHAFTHGLTGPELAIHERKRKVMLLKDAPVRGHNKHMRTTKEPAIAPEARVTAFPNQSLCVDNGRLFCMACKFAPSLRLSTLKIHMGSNEHSKKLALHLASSVDDDDIATLVTRFFEENPVKGASLPTDAHVYRWRVMESMMYAGIPYHKIDMLRHLLERQGQRLCDSSLLGQTFIPQIEEREIKRVVKELMQQHFALIFDGTTRLGRWRGH